MLKQSVFLFCLLVWTTMAFAQKTSQENQYDLVVVSGTPSGIMAAIAASRLGKTALILERTGHPGGLVANGLGATDLISRGATGGLFLEFINRIRDHYVSTYGEKSKQVKDCVNGYHFEPSIGEKVLLEMLAEAKSVTVLTNRQFEADPANLVMDKQTIRSIHVLNRRDSSRETYHGKVFIDATYEGDLIAAAGVPFATGREGIAEHNEPYAGQVYKLWGAEGQEPGSTNLGDNAIQAYNYRLCLTNDPARRVPIPKPPVYNREEYVSIINDVRSGEHAGVEWARMSPEQRDSNRWRQSRGLPPQGKFMPQGMQRLVNKVILPNGKTDANNQHRAFVSTDLPEENWPWATSNWEWRDRFAERLRNYTLGLLYFGQNDPELPEWFRSECREWGFASDEFTDNNNFPRQVYVREGRRMKGMYLFRTWDATPVEKSGRPPVHASSLTASHYGIDSHANRKREKGKTALDGFLSYSTAPYTVPYGVIVPPAITNLLAPVPASATHLGLATLRMEPCWMALGQAAGVAASQQIDKKIPVQKLPAKAIQEELISQKAILIYYRDLKPEHPQFRAIQFAGLNGYLPAWEAKADEAVSAKELSDWTKRSGLSLSKRFSAGRHKKAEVLQYIYDQKLSRTSK